MALDMHDLKTIQTEFKIIGSKIETLNSSLKELVRVMIHLRVKQEMTNVLLEQIKNNTDRHIQYPRMGGPV